MPPVYFITSYSVTNPLSYERDYVPALLETLEGTGAEVVVATGSAVWLEGTPPGQTVVLRFASRDAFWAWYDSDAYTRAREIRHATTTNSTAVLAREFRRSAPSTDGSQPQVPPADQR